MTSEMAVEVEAIDTAAAPDSTMLSPTNSSAGAPDSLRLSEIESAHLCATGRMKMEELFRHWLNVEGTKEMIQGMVEDLRQGKELNFDALLASTAGAVPGSGSGGAHSGGESPSRSPKRPPNYNQFSLLSPTANGEGSPNSRRKHHLVSLFGDELQAAAAELVPEKKLKEEPSPVASTEDVEMNGEGEGAENQEDKSAIKDETAADADAVMETENNGEPSDLKVEIPRFYTPGETRRGRQRGISIDSMTRKKV